jgi:hypothetical protein
MFRKNLDIWIGSYIKQAFNRLAAPSHPRPIDILFCVTDHFEPQWKRPNYQTECARVQTWVSRYPLLAKHHRDADGRPPQHTFFYPEEEYRPEHLDTLAKLCKQGYGEVDIHLHHDRDTPKGFVNKIEQFKKLLSEKHGLLCKDKKTGQVQYGFIHGNWALDNSRKDGRWCGINNELILLKETGCYADFTLPSAPSDTQTPKINSIYYATDNPVRPRSHDTGTDVEVGIPPTGDLLMIQGPLALNFKNRKMGLFPKIENGEITGDNPATSIRADLWINQHIHVKGRPEWVFVKVHTHGTQEESFEALLGKPMDDLLSYLETQYNDGVLYRLHYVTAREMYNIVKAAEAGKSGNPHPYRDYQLVTGGGL